MLAEYPHYDLDTENIGADILNYGEHCWGIGVDILNIGADSFLCGEVSI